MRIEVGAHRSVGSDGTAVHTDRPMTAEQVDQLVRLVAVAGLTMDMVTAVDFVGEGGPVTVEWLDRDHSGRITLVEP